MNIENANELLAYLESLKESGIPLDKVKVEGVCADCNRGTVIKYATLSHSAIGDFIEWHTLTLDWEQW